MLQFKTIIEPLRIKSVESVKFTECLNLVKGERSHLAELASTLL